ncbi:Hypothetical predicted protein [Pelobates cultripes]|uniref:Uncharacterized protein n=1 Tax=Pelobates cultripes TaxID=61616 RepID=A0AAD1W8U6_PELCU|nr:Hypothetical predicted protein [Pelobates cultripes]
MGSSHVVKGSGRRVLCSLASTLAAGGKKHKGPLEMSSAVPDLGEPEEADNDSLLELQNST